MTKRRLGMGEWWASLSEETKERLTEDSGKMMRDFVHQLTFDEEFPGLKGKVMPISSLAEEIQKHCIDKQRLIGVLEGIYKDGEFGDQATIEDIQEKLGLHLGVQK